MFRYCTLAVCKQCASVSHRVRSLRIFVGSNATSGLGSAASEIKDTKEFPVPCKTSLLTTHSKLYKFSANDTCFIKRNFSSNAKKSSFKVSKVKKFPFEGHLQQDIKNKPDATRNPEKRKSVSSGDNHSAKNNRTSLDEIFVRDLLDEYEAQKSVLSNNTPTSTSQDSGNAVFQANASTLPSQGSDSTKDRHIKKASHAPDEADVLGAVAGVLSEVPVFEADEKDEDKLAELPPYNMYERQKEYNEKIQALCKEGDLRGALEVLEQEMPEEKVRLTPYHFRLVIGACAKIGLVDDAFRLFAKMKRHGMFRKPLLYSYLFVACSNAYDPTEHIERITELRGEMARENIELSVQNYHAMLLAFGRCGAVETAFEIFDEMRLSEHVSTRSFNCLLSACISDREVGFRYAIELWHKMREVKVLPDIFTFNLLLRCVVECKSGDSDLLLGLLGNTPDSLPINLSNASKKLKYKKIGARSVPLKLGAVDVLARERDTAGEDVYLQDLTAVESGSSVSVNGAMQKRSNKVKATYFDESFFATNHRKSDSHFSQPEREIGAQSNVPNDQVCDSFEIDGSANGMKTDMKVVVKTKSLHTSRTDSASEDLVTALIKADESPQRLMLLGGLSGVLNSMAAERVRPNMKTFLTLLWALPDTQHCEEELLRAMKDMSMAPNTTFCNMLIKKRGRRGDYPLAKSTLSLLSEHRLSPDIITYGCLALGCRTFSDAVQLLKTITVQGGCPNVSIMLNLVRNAVVTRQYDYCEKLFNQLREHRIVPHVPIIELLEEARTEAIADLKKLENEDTLEAHKAIKERKRFLQRYHRWLKDVPSPREKKTADKQKLHQNVASMLL